MHLAIRRSLSAFFLLGASLAVLSCGDSLGPNGEKLVTVEDNDFDPATKTIAVGETVLWQWKGAAGHNVTWVTSSGAGNSATQATGTYSRTFDTPGTYDYYCTIHGTATSGMHGSVVVQ